MCGADEETLEHFVLQCPGLSDVRRRYHVGCLEGVMCLGVGILGILASFWRGRGQLDVGPRVWGRGCVLADRVTALRKEFLSLRG